MRLQLYLIKKLLTNPYVIGWGVAFGLFWLLTAAFAFGPYIESKIPSTVPDFVKDQIFYLFTSGQFGLTVTISLVGMATGITQIINYHTGAIPYLVRFSKMKGTSYISSLVISSLVTSLIYGVIILALTYVFFSHVFGVKLPPASVPLSIGFILLAGLLYFSFSLFLDMIRVKYLGLSPSATQVVTFLIFIMGYGFGFSAMFAKLGNITYVSPFSAAEFLLLKGYYPHKVYLVPFDSYSVSSAPLFSPEVAILSVIMWTAVFLGVALALFSRISYRSIYEGQI